jgi:peptidoglycan hydrolase-like protein with peptidoglycan-binding domain
MVGGSEKRGEPAIGKRTLTEQLQANGGHVHAAEQAQQGGGGSAHASLEHEVAAAGVSGASSEFPHRNTIENLFGRPVPATAHTDTAAAGATAKLGTEAYAFGSSVAFGSPSPGLHVAAHEAAHVVQQHAGVQLAGGVGTAGEPYEREADAIADRVAAGNSAADLVGGDGSGGGSSTRNVQRYEGKEPLPKADVSGTKDDSARFEGDKKLEQVGAGTEVIQKGSKGLPVTKIQQALIDMGYSLPSGVDGAFDGETETAVKQFQTDEGISPATGKVDQKTLETIDKRFDARKPYLDNAKFDPATPNKGTRKLSAADKAAANKALVPARGTGGVSDTFKEDKYGDDIKAQLDAVIKGLHKELFADKEPLRVDPAKNFHDWSVLEAPAAAAKDATDAVYGSYATAPAMTNAHGNLIDQWDDEVNTNKGLSPARKKAKATQKVWYLINSNCEAVNTAHAAQPDDTKEKAILTPIVESFVDTPAKVQTMLELDVGWEGAQLEGVVYLQRYKQSGGDKNRAQLWELFHTCIHEYIHSLANTKFQSYAATKNATRYNTLIEGFCDFFTENVRPTVTVTDALRTRVEGPYYDKAKPVPAVNPGVYPSRKQAEQLVSICGIRNAEAAYFKGRVELIGGS